MQCLKMLFYINKFLLLLLLHFDSSLLLFLTQNSPHHTLRNPVFLCRPDSGGKSSDIPAVYSSFLLHSVCVCVCAFKCILGNIQGNK